MKISRIESDLVRVGLLQKQFTMMLLPSKKFLVFPALFIFIVGVVGGFQWMKSQEIKQDTNNITNFEECAARGFPVMESYPRQCRAGEKTFIEIIEFEEFVSENVRVTFPKINEPVSSPLEVRGEARGIWFFEASFPIKILDEDGNELGASYVQAQSEWMTKDFVPFAGEITFALPTSEYGVLVLEKDNPSGLPEYADEARIPIRFVLFDPEAGSNKDDHTEEVKLSPACRRTGCSGQVCSDEDVVTTCEFRPEYTCYQAARCERQQNGECGWTMTEDLRSCLRGGVS